MRIYLNRSFRLPLSLDVDQSDTIRSLKGMIQRAQSLSDEEMEQRMLVIDKRVRGREASCPSTLDDGKDLFDDATCSATLEQCGVQEGSMLRVGWKGVFRIRIKSGVSHDIEVGCYDTIRDFKRRIGKITGRTVRKSNFPTVFFSPGADDRTLLSFGFYKVVAHNLTAQHTIFRNKSNQSSFFRRNFTSSSYEEQEEEEDYHPSTKMQVAIEFPNMPWRTPLMYEPTDTLGTVRGDVVRMYYERLEMMGQTCIKEGLFLRTKQLEIDDSATLDECGIKHMDSIQVCEYASFPIVISGVCGQPLPTVEVKCFFTVGKLKEKLRGVPGLPEEKPCLIYKDWYLDDDERRLVYYGIAKPVRYDKSVTSQFRENTPFWDRPDEEFVIHLASSDETEPRGRGAAQSGILSEACSASCSTEFPELRPSSKSKRKGKTHDKTPFRYHYKEKAPIHPASSKNKEPWRSVSTEADIFVKESSSLPPVIFPSDDQFSATKLQITVEIPNSPWRFPFTFKPTDTVGTVRESIIDRCWGWVGLFDQSYIEKDMFVLIFDTKELEDESITLDRNGIKHTDSIQLFEKTSFHINVIASEHKRLTRVVVRCYDTVGMLKEKIQDKTNIPKENQQLTYSALYLSWILDDDKGFLVDYGITKKVEYKGTHFPYNPQILVSSSKRRLNDNCSAKSVAVANFPIPIWA